MEKFEKREGKEKFENATSIVQESSYYETELLMVEGQNSAYGDC